jgi:uncharacterized RDD family membrane protein YckC
MDTLNEPITNTITNVTYGGFWVRVAASLIDMLVLAPLTFGVAYFNITDWKSVAVLILINIVALGYKPVMEFIYGATLGKMSVNLEVVNLQFEKPSLNEVLLRNVFHIGGVVISLIISIVVFTDPGFEEVSGWIEYSAFSQNFPGSEISQWLITVIVLIDLIVLLADEKKRSWHDKIAKTYVIVQAS